MIETKEVIKKVDGVETKEQKEWKYFQLSAYKCPSLYPPSLCLHGPAWDSGRSEEPPPRPS